MSNLQLSYWWFVQILENISCLEAA